MAHLSPGALRRHVKPRDLVTSQFFTSKGPSMPPFEIMDAKAQRWAQTWRHGACQDDRIAALRSAQQDAHVDLPALSVSHLGSVARGLSDCTGRGFDNLGPSDTWSLHAWPRGTCLLALYHEIERLGQWPWQLLVNLICLEPKPTSGDRGIALMTWLVRLWTQPRDAPTREWSHAGFWDQAVEGSAP